MRRKYYKTELILTVGLSEVLLGKSLCANPLVFINKTAIAILAKSGRLVKYQNGGILNVRKVL